MKIKRLEIEHNGNVFVASAVGNAEEGMFIRLELPGGATMVHEFQADLSLDSFKALDHMMLAWKTAIFPLDEPSLSSLQRIHYIIMVFISDLN